MTLKLMFLMQKEFTPKDNPKKTYQVYYFADINSLQVITGTDLGKTFKEYEFYNVKVVYKNGKFKVVDA